MENKTLRAEKETYVRENGTKGVRTVLKGKTLTQQQFKDECDVNKIMDKYLKTGSITHLNNRQSGAYLNLVDLPDYQQCLDITIQAQNTFMALPAKIRNKFENDPEKLIQYLADPKNIEESIKLGLRNKPKEEVVSNKVPATDPVAPTEPVPGS